MKHYVLISLVLCLLGCDGLVNPEHNAKPIIHKSADKPEQISETQTKTPSVPIEYRNALKQAASYATRMHMSKQGVYDQLVSEYGEQFSPEAAQYAIEKVQADWNKNALMQARQYQERMAMSRARIREQLMSPHGEKFTEAEADYAIQNL